MAERTIRGLFYSVFGQRIPSQYDLLVDEMFYSPFRSEADQSELEKLLAELFAGATEGTKGDGVFHWRHKSAVDDSFSSLWAIAFFDNIVYGGVVSERPAKVGVDSG